MRASTAHTPPFVTYGHAELGSAEAMDQVYDAGPAVMLWVADELGEDHFMDLVRAALRRDMRELDRARDSIVEKWRTADRAWWQQKAQTKVAK